MSNNNNILQNNGMQAAAGSSAFLGAPVTKFFVTVSMLSFLVAVYSAMDHDEQEQKIVIMNETLQTYFHLVSFASIGEVMVFGGALAMPLVRQFEREFGSRLFFSFFLCVVIMNVVFREFMKVTFGSDAFEEVLELPYVVIGMLLYLYHEYTPRLHPKFMGILGVDLSEKSMKYLLFFMAGMFNVLPVVLGYISALLCSSNAVFSFISNHVKFPESIYKLVNTILGPWFVEYRRTQFAAVSQRQTQQQFGATQMANNLNNNSQRRNQFQQQQLPRAPPPSEEAIQNLTSMGFDRDDVIRTLQQCDNNVEVAANRLLS